MGGFNTHECQALSSVETYSFDTKQWTMMQPLTIPRVGHCAAVCKDQIFVLGGNQDTAGRRVEVYDSETQQWKIQSTLHTARFGSSLVCL